MADFYDEVNELVNDIVAGKTNVKEVKIAINRIKSQFGFDAFPSFSFEKQLKPWDFEYLHELQIKNVTGACSEEFIMHMAEVSDYVFGKRRKNIIGAIVAIAIVIIMIIVMILNTYNGKHKNEEILSSSNYYSEELKDSYNETDVNSADYVLMEVQ